MDGLSRQSGGERNASPSPDTASDDTLDAASDTSCEASSEPLEESLLDEAGALIDNARNYAHAELAFQKTRAALAGRSIGIALGAAIVAIILLHIAFLALAVGLVIALAPLVSTWGAIGIVVGVLLLLTGLLGWIALANGKKLGKIFSSGEEGEG